MGVFSFEQNQLLDHYRICRDVAIVIRCQVVMLHLKGWSVLMISEAVFKPESTISRWITAYKKHGIGWVFPGYYHNQNATKLTIWQKQEVKKLLDNQPLPGEFWSLKDLKKYLSARFDVEYDSPQSYYALLRFCNFSYKLPSLFNIKRDNSIVEEKMKEIRTIITPLLNDPNVIVFASDESRLDWSTRLRRAWLRRGEKTIIKERRNVRYQSFIGFLNLKTGEELLGRLKWQSHEYIIPILKGLVRKYPRKRIIIVWDNAGFHKSKYIKAVLGPGKPLRRITLINFPTYAPDKNPQELIWKYGKDGISNKVFNRFEDLVSTFETIITGRKYPYQIC
jgi:transposase